MLTLSWSAGFYFCKQTSGTFNFVPALGTIPSDIRDLSTLNSFTKLKIYDYWTIKTALINYPKNLLEGFMYFVFVLYCVCFGLFIGVPFSSVAGDKPNM